MNLFFGTLATAFLLFATVLGQGVLVLPQQAGDNGVARQQTSVAPAVSPPPIQSPVPAPSSPPSIVLAQNAPPGSAASNPPPSITPPIASFIQTSAPAPAASSPKVMVLANEIYGQTGSVASTQSSVVQNPLILPSAGTPPPAPNTISETKLEAPSSTTMVKSATTPSGYLVLPQPVDSQSGSNSLSAGVAASSSTLMQSRISVTAPLSAQSGLPNSGVMSPSGSAMLSSSMSVEGTAAIMPLSPQSGLPSTGTTGNNPVVIPSASSMTAQNKMTIVSSAALQSGLPTNGVLIPPGIQSGILSPSAPTDMQSVTPAAPPGSTLSQNAIPASSAIAAPSDLPVKGVATQSASSAGTIMSGSSLPTVAPIGASPQSAPAAQVSNGDSHLPVSQSVSAQIKAQSVAANPAAPASAIPSIVLAQQAQAQDCRSPGGVNGIDPSCWNSLDMSKYTNTWWATNNAKCGGPTANFSTCFWELHNLGTRDCTSVTPGACPEPDTSQLSAQDWYIAYNIYAINQVFSSLYLAIMNANSLVSETVGAIVALLNPPKKVNLLISDLLTAVSATINIILPVGTLFQRHLIALTQQTPPVSKFLFPIGTTESQIIQWESIQQELAIIVQNYQGNVSQIIPTINNNIDLFVTFAESGAFSVNPLPNLANESDKLLLGLNTYVISKALQANNLVIGQSTDTDINQLVANSSVPLPYDTGCQGKGYSSEGLCGPFYYDPTIGNSFSLDNLGDMRTNYTHTLEIILGNWTTGDMLFGGSYRCQNNGGVQGSLAQTVISTNGNITLDCLSSIKVCEWNLGSLDSDKEFTDCPTQAGYVVNGCKGCPDGSMDVNVPNGYAGAYLANPGTLDCVCNT